MEKIKEVLARQVLIIKSTREEQETIDRETEKFVQELEKQVKKKKIKEDPVEKGKLVAEKTAEAKAEVEQEAIDQLEKKEDDTLSVLLNTEPKQ